MSEVLLSAKGVCKRYPTKKGFLEVLAAIDLEVFKSETLCIMGASGTGKSTLLHILGTLDRPSLGSVFYRNRNLTKMNSTSLAKFRNESLGFVFQFHHLLTEFNAVENVMAPCRIAGESKAEAQKKADEILEIVGLSDRRTHFPSELSGGEQQRVAIARALVRRPEVLMADEPTGNLDSTNAAKIKDLFFRLHQEMGLTLVVVTHDANLASHFSRVKQLVDGKWVS